MIRKLLTLFLLLGTAATLAMAGNEEMRTYEMYSGANAADSSARVSYRIPVKGARKIYLWVRSAGASTDTSYCDSLTTFAALFGDSVSFMARDSAGTLVTLRPFPLNIGGYNNKAFPVIADSVSLSTTGAADTLHWHILYHFATTRPLRTGVIAEVAPAKPIDALTGAAVFIPKYVPDPAGLIQSNYLWLRLTPTTRLTTAGYNSTAGLRTTGVNGLRVTATVVYSSR